MKYIIISLKHGTGEYPVFWRADDAGYTSSPFAAGIYTEDQVKNRPNYYNDGYMGIAIPITGEAMQKIDFKCSFNIEALEAFHSKQKI